MDNASALRRQLLAELRHLRPPHIVTQKQVADALDWSPSKVTRIENGSVSISVTDLRALLAYYGVTGPEVVDGLVDLARRSRRARSPFAAFGDVFSPDALRFFDYEHSATWIGSIELLVVPGLLQTEDYARTVMGVHGVGAERAERFVSSRRVRQEVLDRPDPPTLSFIVDESVLLRAIGGRAVMRAQLEHLLEVAARPNVDDPDHPAGARRARRPARAVRPAALLRHERPGRRLHRAAPRRRHLPGRAGGDREPRAPVRRAREARCVTARPLCVREAGD